VGGRANDAIWVLNFETEHRDVGKAASVNIPGGAAVSRIINPGIGSDVDIGRTATGQSYRIDCDRVSGYIRQSGGHGRPGNYSGGKIDSIEVCRFPNVSDRCGIGAKTVKTKISDRFIVRINCNPADAFGGSGSGSVSCSGPGDLQQRGCAKGRGEDLAIIQTDNSEIVILRRNGDCTHRYAALKQLTRCCCRRALVNRAVEFVRAEVPGVWVAWAECLRRVEIHGVTRHDPVQRIRATVAISCVRGAEEKSVQ
jgi:hypothetical protein